MQPEFTYEANGITLIHGDALDLLDTVVADAQVNLVFADPPYNIGKKFGGFHDRWESDDAYASWSARWLDLCIKKLAPDGTMYVMASTQAMPFLDLYLRTRLSILSRIVWAYDSSGVQAKKYFGSLYEPILHAVKDPEHYTFNAEAIAVEARTGAVRHLIDYRKPTPTLYNSKKVPGNVWSFPRVRYRMDEYEEHPSQKPEVLLERIVLASSNPGDLVLDPFAGTFTTGAVARRLGRRFIGVEREREYIKIGLRRLGIRKDLDGEALAPPQKTYVRRNGPGGSGNADEMTGDLFGPTK
ncbi:MAG: adenine-specific DNA-methyltransferase [Planctomycetes bacterium]|nr:adenine-specific DNA-methyltransferase [Planctomycetota bacterium]